VLNKGSWSRGTSFSVRVRISRMLK
jgi:hypothetical protein